MTVGGSAKSRSLAALGTREWVVRAGRSCGSVRSCGGLSILTAIQQQLGLKLEPVKVATEVIVIDHLEKVPTAN
jgi:uncharacterized protein (TIGR03435 family)